MPPAPARVPSQRPVAPSVASVTSVTNDKGDNAMILGAVHRSPGICLTAEENPRKPQLEDRLMKGLCDQSSNEVGRITQHVRKVRRKERRSRVRLVYDSIPPSRHSSGRKLNILYQSFLSTPLIVKICFSCRRQIEDFPTITPIQRMLALPLLLSPHLKPNSCYIRGKYYHLQACARS